MMLTSSEAQGSANAASDKQPICIVTGCDEGFARPLAVTLFSALTHLDKQQDIALFIIDGGITPESKKRLERIVRRVRPGSSISWVAPAIGSMEGLEGARHLPAAAYLRIFIPFLLPPSVSRVLYLDCDLLVKGNLAELWNVGLGGCSIAASRDFAVSHMAHPWSVIPDYQELGIRPEAAYFNSGVLLVDVAQWRQDQTAARVLE